MRLRVVASGGVGQDLSVGPRGVVDLPREVHTRDSAHRRARDAPDGPGAAARPAVAVGEVAVRGLAPPRPDAGGTFASHCGALALRAGPSVATARVSGTIAALDAGRPLRLAGCGRRALLDLPSGASRVVAPRRRPACGPPRAQRAGTRTAAAAGGAGSGDRADGGRRAPRPRAARTRPARLARAGGELLGRWRAWCRGTSGHETELGAPVPIDGFANGWRVGKDCREARFAFTPQRLADAAYLVSGVACVGMLLILLVLALRRWRARAVVLGAAAAAASAGPEAAPAAPDADRVQRAHPLVALACGLVAGGLGWLSFGPRAGVVAGIAVCLLLVVGVSVGRLIATATVALVALAVLYLADPAPRPGGSPSPTPTTTSPHIRWPLWRSFCLGGAAVLAAVRLRAANRRRATAASPDPVPRDAPAHQPNTNDRAGDVGPAARRLPRMPRS